jgi:hypothetical protein
MWLVILPSMAGDRSKAMVLLTINGSVRLIAALHYKEWLIAP